MLPRSDRLTLKSDFALLHQRGKRYQSSDLRLTVYREPSPRRLIAFAVSKKVSKRAVDRNLVKRWLRAAYLAHRIRLGEGYLLLFSARPSSLNSDYRSLSLQVQTLLRSAGLYAPEAVAQPH